MHLTTQEAHLLNFVTFCVSQKQFRECIIRIATLRFYPRESLFLQKSFVLACYSRESIFLHKSIVLLPKYLVQNFTDHCNCAFPLKSNHCVPPVSRRPVEVVHFILGLKSDPKNLKLNLTLNPDPDFDPNYKL